MDDDAHAQAQAAYQLGRALAILEGVDDDSGWGKVVAAHVRAAAALMGWLDWEDFNGR